MKKSVISVVALLTGMALGVGVISKMEKKKLSKALAMSQKHLELFKMMVQWVRVKQEGKKLDAYFKARGYKKIAIYGMSYAGEVLLNELKETEITVAYGIDRNADMIDADVDVVMIEDGLAEVDAIVITAITFFDEIEEQLQEKISCPILSLEDILYEV